MFWIQHIIYLRKLHDTHITRSLFKRNLLLSIFHVFDKFVILVVSECLQRVFVSCFECLEDRTFLRSFSRSSAGL